MSAVDPTAAPSEAAGTPRDATAGDASVVPVADATTRPIRMNAGEHRVCASKPGADAHCRTLTVEPGSRTTLTFPEPLGASAARVPAERADDPGAHGYDGRWVAWAAAGAFAASATVAGVLALGAHADQKDAQKQQGITRPELDQAKSKTDHLALATDLFLAGAAVSTGVALYLQLSGSHERSEAPRSSARLVLRPTGMDFAFRF